ncbi:hypothetical protein [Candidatus Uabimicrobium amorphum]|uniref:Lipoprotein n=1 Tax=Uabimicrobium amorphum TaxID=2596890 RepID=A0A5S9ITQ0_UABAM|nr:hypothetical protein [Candidatus Uabimicrobium amorphum]BBM87978.1 hypothetical protein UABAM_06394 [Candidatus Uabimicrobium amorphum]
MRYVFWICFLVLTGCFSSTEVNEPPQQTEKVTYDAEACSFIDNKTRVKFVLLVKKMALNEQFQICASEIIKYAQRHYMLDLHANQIVNRYINTSTMKRHLSHLDKIMAETMTKKERQDLYLGMAEILPVTGLTTPEDDQQLFELSVIHNLMCYSGGILQVLKKYEDSVTSDEQRKVVAENKKNYQQKPVVEIDMDAFFDIPQGEEIAYPEYTVGSTGDENTPTPTKKKKAPQTPQQKKARSFVLVNPQEKGQTKGSEGAAAPKGDGGGSSLLEPVAAKVKEVTQPAANQVEQKVRDLITEEVQKALGN